MERTEQSQNEAVTPSESHEDPTNNYQEDQKQVNKRMLRLTGAFLDHLPHMGEGKTRYRGVIPLDKLSGIWRVPRLSETDTGYQREASKRKVREIAADIFAGGIIEGTIVLVAHAGCPTEWHRKNRTLEVETQNLLNVLDGQHRLLGYDLYVEACQNETLRTQVLGKEGASQAETKPRDLSVQVAIYVGLTPAEEAALFEKINATQTKVPEKLLADVRHRFGAEKTVDAAASEIFDELSVGVFKDVAVVRSNFLKLAHPLLAPKRGKVTGYTLADRQMLLTQFLQAVAHTVKPDVLKLNCTVRAACAVFEETLYQAVTQKFVGDGVEGFKGFLWPLEKLELDTLPSRSGAVVADQMRDLLFPVLVVGGAGEMADEEEEG